MAASPELGLASCRYFMAFDLCDQASELLIVFPQTLPKLHLLQPVYQEVHELITESFTHVNFK